jgi:hypothetical protein
MGQKETSYRKTQNNAGDSAVRDHRFMVAHLRRRNKQRSPRPSGATLGLSRRTAAPFELM